jgi:hypothetical protein
VPLKDTFLFLGKCALLTELFSHELSDAPPSLATIYGRLFHGKRSDLVPCFKDCLENFPTVPELFEAVIDGGPLIHRLIRQVAKHFLNGKISFKAQKTRKRFSFS